MEFIEHITLPDLYKTDFINFLDVIIDMEHIWMAVDINKHNAMKARYYDNYSYEELVSIFTPLKPLLDDDYFYALLETAPEEYIPLDMEITRRDVINCININLHYLYDNWTSNYADNLVRNWARELFLDIFDLGDEKTLKTQYYDPEGEDEVILKLHKYINYFIVSEDENPPSIMTKLRRLKDLTEYSPDDLNNLISWLDSEIHENFSNLELSEGSNDIPTYVLFAKFSTFDPYSLALVATFVLLSSGFVLHGAGRFLKQMHNMHLNLKVINVRLSLEKCWNTLNEHQLPLKFKEKDLNTVLDRWFAWHNTKWTRYYHYVDTFMYYMGLTLALGLLFVCIQTFEYTYSLPFAINDSVFGSSFYLLTGFHGFHVIVGLIGLFFFFMRVWNARVDMINLGFEMAAWYWHFVDGIWIFVYLIVYWWSSEDPKIIILDS